ncbi:MAG: hypothetical protein FWD04_01235, partial [Conexibacteraceae bacterium]|nr:hypothetical protein [Conexibacteraceae bacterium]
MSGPKHLWSGNWEDESARVAQDRAVQPRLGPVEPEQPAPGPAGQGQPGVESRSFRRLTLRYAALVGVLVIALGVGLAAALTGGSPKHHRAHTPTSIASTQQPSQQQQLQQPQQQPQQGKSGQQGLVPQGPGQTQTPGQSQTPGQTNS